MLKMNLYSSIYALLIGALSLFQIVLGANLIVLAAIDAVCLCAIYPMTRKAFDPNDLLFLSMCFYYGTFSLILKCLVLQPVQMNLQVPLETSAYLVGGFGLIFLGYVFVSRTMTQYYAGTQLRRWNLFERSFANEQFLARYTLPFSVLSLAFVIVVALTSHSVQEVATGLASSGGLAALGGLVPVIQLAFAMQLALMTRRGKQTDRTLVFTTMAVALTLSILNNQKQLAFLMSVTFAVHALAYRVPIRPRFAVVALALAAVAFLYIMPLIHIVRSLDVEKSQRLSVTLSILQEAHYNPAELSDIDSKVPGANDENSLARRLDYLAPYSLNTDRFTLLMPIDQTARADMREPLGIGAYLSDLRTEILPKFIIGEHPLEVLDDIIAWRYSIRENGVISRPVLGLLGTGYGTEGPLGLLVLAPLVTLIFFAVFKYTCNGSVWQNPWAVFIASYLFFFGEADITLPIAIVRTLVPLLAIAGTLVGLYSLFDKGKRRPAII